MTNLICTWSQIKRRIWFVFDLKSNDEFDLHVILNLKSNREWGIRSIPKSDWDLKWFYLIHILDLKSSIDVGIKSIPKSNWVWSDLIWFKCLIWNQVLVVESNQYRNQTGFEVIWFDSNAWSEIKAWMWYNQYRDQTAVWNYLNWIRCLIWNQDFDLKQSVQRSNRSLKLSELNQVVDHLSV